MCGAGIAGGIVKMVGGAVSSYGTYTQGSYSQKINNNNALIQDRLAEDALRRGKNEEIVKRLETGDFKERQRATMGASGVSVNSESFQRTLADTAMAGELDALMIRSNSEREAYGHRVQAQNFRTQGKIDKYAGILGAHATMLNSVGGALGG